MRRVREKGEKVVVGGVGAGEHERAKEGEIDRAIKLFLIVEDGLEKLYFGISNQIKHLLLYRSLFHF